MNWKETIESWGYGFHQVSDLLVRRGTAMGPLIPTLFLVPAFLVAAWVFKEQIYISVILVFASIATLFFYMWRYACYAIEDPDRLQSEEFGYEMKRMHLIAAKELPQPIPVNELNLSEPTVNPEIGEPDGEIARGKQ